LSYQQCLLAQEPQVRTVEPRAFGYVVGDLIERQVVLQLPQAMTLPAEALPRPGRIDAWLALRHAQLQGSELRLTYQMIGAPAAVRTITLPSLALQPLGAAHPIEIPEYQVTAGPLTPELVAATPGLPELQPDRVPVRADLTSAMARVAAMATLFALLLFLAYALRHPELAFWRRRGPFRTAWLALRKLRSADGAASRVAFEHLHAAFNAAAGRAVFGSDLAPLFAAQPALTALRVEIELFFAWSRETFFAGSDPALATPRLADLKALSERLARLESRSLRAWAQD
jgi:mxaA protein